MSSSHLDSDEDESINKLMQDAQHIDIVDENKRDQLAARAEETVFFPVSRNCFELAKPQGYKIIFSDF